MSRISKIMSLYFSEGYNIDSGVDSLFDEVVIGNLIIDTYAPKNSNLYMTIPHPAIGSYKILEYGMSISKILGNGSVIKYALELYRDAYDIGTYNLLLQVYLDDLVYNWIDYKITPQQLVLFIKWLKKNQYNSDFDGIFNLILDDYINLKIQDGLYYIILGKKNDNFDESLLALTEDEFIVFLDQLNNLNLNVNSNSSVYNFHRLYREG